MKRQPTYRPEDRGLPSGPLECIPGVGRNLAWDLIDLGIHLIEDRGRPTPRRSIAI